MTQIFGCPYCQNPFGVPDNAAGQTFECPSCDQPVEVPDLVAPEPEVYRCPHCEGEFAIDSTMHGQQLACPHCENHVAIGEQSTPPPRVEEEEEIFDVVIEDEPIVVVVPTVPPKRSRKKSSSKKEAVGRESPRKEKGKGAARRTSEGETKAPAAEQPSAPRQKPPSRKPPSGKPNSAESPRQSESSKARRKRRVRQTVDEDISSVEKRSPLAGSSVHALRKIEDSHPIESNSTQVRSSASTSLLEPRSVSRLLPPTFDVPDPVRFPHKIGANEILLPDGQGGYQTAEANVVTITHEGKVYHLQRLTSEERRKRQLIHNAIAISIAVLLIFLTLQTVGFFS